MVKPLLLSSLFFSSTLFAQEGSVMLHSKSKGATIYIDGKRVLTIENRVTPIKVEEGDHLIKMVEPLTGQCEKYAEKEVYVSAEGSVNITLELPNKLEPTSHFKKIRDKRDAVKLERFNRSNKDVVTDKYRGIMWQDSKVTRTQRDLTDAKHYCKQLDLADFKDWRLPTYRELLSMVDYDRYNASLMPSFQNGFASSYWTKTEDVSSLDYFWSVDFYRGESHAEKSSEKDYVRCVRGVSQPKASKLIWDDSRASKTVKKDWKSAKEYCQEMLLGAKDDWRLPTLKELQSIVNIKSYKPAIKNEFKYVAQDYYWSTTEDISTDGYAWNVAFNYGHTTRASTLNEYGVRCVRDE
jgi:hypothetical protein